MPTTDNTQSTFTPAQGQGNPNLNPANPAVNEFDFQLPEGNVPVAAPQPEINASPADDLNFAAPEAQINTLPEQNFDFTLDLPESFEVVEASEVAPTVEVASVTEASPSIETPAPTMMQELLNEEAPVVEPAPTGEEAAILETPAPAEGNQTFMANENTTPEVMIVEETAPLDPFEAMKASLNGEIISESELNQLPLDEEGGSLTPQIDTPAIAEARATVEEIPVEPAIEPVSEVETPAPVLENTTIPSFLQDDTPLPPATETASKVSNFSVPTMNIPSPVESVVATPSDIAPAPTLDTMPSFGTSNMEMPSMEATPTMSVTTPAENSPAPVENNTLAPETETAPSMPAGMLSLDEMIAQPSAPTSMTEAPAPSINLDALTPQAMMGNPLTQPVAAPAMNTTPANTNSTKVAVFSVLGIFILSIVGAVLYLRDPLMFQNLGNLLGASSPTPIITQQDTQNSDLEHSAADLETTDKESENDENLIESEANLDTTDETTSDDTLVLEPSESEEEDNLEEINLESDEETSLPTPLADQSENNSTETTLSDEPVDALGAVEDLLGQVGGQDVLTLEIQSYKENAQKLAEAGKAQGERMKIKWGTYVAQQVEKLQQELENGKKMTIFEWNTLKSELDQYLAKATNEAN